MTDPSPAALLRDAAEEVRQWATDATSDPWAPGAAARFGPELAAWLEYTAGVAEAVTRKYPDVLTPDAEWLAPALAVARQIRGDES